MNERHLDEYLKHTLKKRADKDIPEMTTLKDRILAQTTPNTITHKSPMRLRRRWSAALVLVLIISTSAVYAFTQLFVQPDAGLQAVQPTTLNITQPINGTNPDSAIQSLNVTLDYAYADRNRIAAAYKLTIEAASDAGLQIFSNPTLTDSAGNSYLWIPSSGEQNTSPSENGETIVHSGIMSFDASGITGNPSALGLQLRLEVAYSTAADPMGMALFGETTFNFNVPFNGGRVLTLDQTVNGTAQNIHLQKAVITPSLTRLEVCFSNPQAFAVDAWLSWQAPITLSVNGQQVLSDVQASFAGINGAPLEADAACRSLIIPEALMAHTGQWQITLGEFENTESGQAVDGSWSFSFNVD